MKLYNLFRFLSATFLYSVLTGYVMAFGTFLAHAEMQNVAVWLSLAEISARQVYSTGLYAAALLGLMCATIESYSTPSLASAKVSRPKRKRSTKR